MADVFVAFVREDQAFAEAIAIALQDAGLAVSRSASVMDAIDASPAVVVLWTPASSRSRLFLDAADRAFRSGKMVLARLGGAAAPADYATALQHSFHSWSGDPDHNELGVIVAHVLRLSEFSRGRAAVSGGAGVVHPFPSPAQRGLAGPSAQAQLPLPPPQPAPQPPPYAPPQAGDGRMLEEVTFWRQVQASGELAAYQAYLERFGSQGAFAEIAEMKLRTAAPPQRAPQQPPLPPPMPPQPAPASRYAPPQPPAVAPPYRPSAPNYGAPQPPPAPPPYAPPPYAPPPYPPQRAAPAPQPPAPGRLDFNRPPTVRPQAERPRGAAMNAPAPSERRGAGGLGALVFLLVLAGLAAGGWFVFNGGSFTGAQRTAEPTPMPPPRMIAPIKDGAPEAPPAELDAGPRTGAGAAKAAASEPPPREPPPPATAASRPRTAERAPTKAESQSRPASRASSRPPAREAGANRQPKQDPIDRGSADALDRELQEMGTPRP